MYNSHLYGYGGSELPVVIATVNDEFAGVRDPAVNIYLLEGCESKV